MNSNRTDQGSEVEVQDSLILDEQDAITRFGGDAELLATMCEVMQDELASMTDELVKAFGNGEAETLGRAAHSLKGALSNISACTATETTRRIEMAARSSDISTAQKEFDELVPQLEQLRNRMNEIISRNANK